MSIKLVFILLIIILSSYIVNAAIIDQLDRYYTFDTAGPGQNVPDSLGITNGTNMSAKWVSDSGIIGSSYNFTPGGSTKNITTATINAMNTNTSFTINFWAKISARGQTYFAESQGTGDALAFAMAENGGGSLFLTVVTRYLNFGTSMAIVSATNQMLGVWQMHTIVVDVPNRKVIYYINGTNTFNSSAASDVSFATTTANLTIGDDNRGGSSIGGSEDEWGIWNRVLTPKEIIVLYSNGVGSSYPFTTLFLTIISPTNSTYNVMPNLTFTYINTTPVDKCWYYNGTANTTAQVCANYTGLIWQQGPTNLILYINDTSTNTTSASITFTTNTIIVFSNYNLTSHGTCIAWQSNPQNVCNTTDGQPIITFNTSYPVNCSIQNIPHNYNTSFKCEITNGMGQQCTLGLSQKLAYGLTNLSLGCADPINYGNSSNLLVNMTAGTGGGLINCISLVGSGCAAIINNNCAAIYGG